MRTNLYDLRKKFQEIFVGENYEKTSIVYKINTKKEDVGVGSITIEVTTPNAQSGKESVMSSTLYIFEKQNVIFALFTNDKTKDVIYNNISADAVERAINYIETYINRSVLKMLGVEIADGSKPTKRTHFNNGTQRISNYNRK